MHHTTSYRITHPVCRTVCICVRVCECNTVDGSCQQPGLRVNVPPLHLANKGTDEESAARNQRRIGPACRGPWPAPATPVNAVIDRRIRQETTRRGAREGGRAKGKKREREGKRWKERRRESTPLAKRVTHLIDHRRSELSATHPTQTTLRRPSVSSHPSPPPPQRLLDNSTTHQTHPETKPPIAIANVTKSLRPS